MKKREVVVVTGASAGLGRATVRAFAKSGADIGLMPGATEGLENAGREVEQAVGRAVAVPHRCCVRRSSRTRGSSHRKSRLIDIWSTLR
jgi:NAD(P)-dependent dehydrogenase (short-subunit alcohol dehydrogenase family)